jgi:multiple sugar transport system permease protein
MLNNDLVHAQKRTPLTATMALLFVICAVVAFIMVIPFAWMVSASFKAKSEIFTKPIRWIPEVFRSDNYVTMWTTLHFPRLFLNTAKLAVVITVLQLFTCSLAAYSFSKLHFRGRDTIFLVYLATMMVPWQSIMIPQFMIVQRLGLYDTHLSLILIQAFSAFGVFVLRQNMLSIPDSLCEAPKMDGCGPFATYWRIILPLTKVGLVTLTLLTFNYVWNDYLGPMIYLDKEVNRTIQLGLATFKRQYDRDYGAIMAGTCISIIPVVILYAFAQKQIIEGVAFTGIKG